MSECRWPRVQICRANSLARRPDLLARLRQEGLLPELVECLDQCRLCDQRAVGLLSGRYLYAPGPDELCERLLAEAPSAAGRPFRASRP